MAMVHAKMYVRLVALVLACHCLVAQVVVVTSNGDGEAQDSGSSGEALLDASKENNATVMEELVDEGLDVSGTFGEDEMTPLHLAAQKGALDEAKVLIKEGANVNAGNAFKATPLHYAASGGHIEIVQLLLDNDANVHIGDHLDYTPLFRAALNNHANVVELLIENGAHLDVTDKKFGKTALQRASEQGFVDVVKVLVENGANKAIRDKNGETALSSIGSDASDLSTKDRAEIEALLQ